MFVLFMITLFCIVWVAKAVSDLRDEKLNKEIAIKNGRDFYINRKGHKVKISPDGDYVYDIRREVSYGKRGIIYGDTVEYNPINGKIIRNLTQEKRDALNAIRRQRRAQALKEGKAYYLYDKHEWDGFRNEDDLGTGYEFADTETNDVFMVSRTIYGNVLWNVKTGYYERIVDEELLSPKKVQYLRTYMNALNENGSNLEWVRSKKGRADFAREFHNEFALSTDDERVEKAYPRLLEDIKRRKEWKEEINKEVII